VFLKLPVFALAGLLLALAAQEPVTEKNPATIPAGAGQKPFDVTVHAVPLNEIQKGGPPRDGIPALDHPAFLSAGEAEKVLRPSDLVLGIATGDVARAYPVRVLNWHEVVNDDIGPLTVLITWCPLCGSGMVFDPRVRGTKHTFRVSGLLYKRNLLLYDRETDSLWSQLAGKAVSGPLSGSALRLLPSTVTTWARWREEHPATTVLSFQTGYSRDYTLDPYRELPLDRRMALVVSTEISAAIYPYSELKKAGPYIKDALDGREFTVAFDSKNDTAILEGREAEQLSHFVAFVAAARAFYPRAKVFKAK
jgi:hypothetical protein